MHRAFSRIHLQTDGSRRVHRMTERWRTILQGIAFSIYHLTFNWNWSLGSSSAKRKYPPTPPATTTAPVTDQNHHDLYHLGRKV